jgi:hypothetical protein
MEQSRDRPRSRASAGAKDGLVLLVVAVVGGAKETAPPRTPDQIHRLTFGTSRQPEIVSIEFTDTRQMAAPREVDP